MDRLRRLAAQIKLRIELARARYGFVDTTFRVFKRFSEDDGGPFSAALTYYVFFSLFPLVSGIAAILGFVIRNNPTLQQDILNKGLGQFPLLGQFVNGSNISTVQNKAGVFLLIAVLLALYSGSGAVVALQHALNRIERVPVVDEGNFVAKRLNSLKWLGVLGLLAIASLVLGSVAGFAEGFFGAGSSSILALVLGHVIGFAVGAGMFVTAFMFLTSEPHGWREVLPGALIASAVFELLKQFGAWYLNRGGAARSAQFGAALADAAALLVAAYLLCQVILLSAEVNAVLRERRTIRTSHAPQRTEEAS
jgi:inner membrane protein YhjD